MKKVLSLVLVLCLLWSCCFAEGTDAPADDFSAYPSLWEEGNTHAIERKTLPAYVGSLENLWPEELPVYFIDGTADLPWMDLQEFAEFLGVMLSSREGGEQSDIDVAVNDERGMVIWTRRDSDLVVFDFAEQQIHWTDYQGFSRQEGRPYLDILQNFRVDDGNGQTGVIRAGEKRERLGSTVTLDLRKYGVPMLAQDGLYLVPLQTLSSFFLSQGNLGMYFNQECLIVTSPSTFNQMTVAMQAVPAALSPEDIAAIQSLPPEEAQAKTMELLQQALASREQPSLYNTYMSGPKGERSLAMTDYGLHELAMELDYLYGLKEVHDIDDFLLYFAETGLLSGLSSSDPMEADTALRELTNVWLDDGHTEYYSGSYLREDSTLEAAGVVGGGISKPGRKKLRESLGAIRTQALGAAVPFYTEIGDTAFLTLDGFLCTNVDYYADPENLPPDTIGEIIKAHKQITRENSPVKTVVVDLSINNGGDAPSAVYLLSWMLGDARVSLKSTLGGAESTVEYRADVNLDHVFDEQDTLAGRGLRLFCLTSPASFSCGNLVPWAFKENGTVKLLGGATGGGSCIILPLTTAWGSSYAISGPVRLSFLNNGAYYDVDRGAEPDYVISSYERFYDREALAEYIRNLY